MSILLIGARGLVGSAFVRYFETKGIAYQPVYRENMQDVAGISCDLVINCSGNGHKGKAAQNPHWDFEETVTSTAHYVHSINTQRFIHISSVDVYTDPSDRILTDEASIFAQKEQSVYGFHKYLAECCVLKFANSPLVLRLPALVGPGLKKNPIFDHFHAEKHLFINAESKLNIIHTDYVAAATFSLLDQGASEPTMNLAAKDSLTIEDLPGVSGLENSFHADARNNKQLYEINTGLISKYLDLPTSASAVEQYMRDIAL